MEEMIIRAVDTKDFDDIYLLLQQLWPDKELNKKDLMEIFSRGIKSQNELYFCAELNGKVIGFCSLGFKNSLWQEGYIGYVNEIVVDKLHRGKGIGTALLKAATDAAKEKGCKRIEMDSAFQRKEAHQFYEKSGFEKRAYLFSKKL